MLKIREMTHVDADILRPMFDMFYRSSAMDHPVPESVLNRTFRDAVTDGTLLRGLVLEDASGPVGFAYVTSLYSTEIGGVTVMLEDLYFVPEVRGKGYGTEFLHWLENAYPKARRFRLEVTPENTGAARLYQKLGFHYVRYHQMAKERP
ncbi:MAG TPA: GNAT family N-acetyltransferase [Candidatus Scatomonas pullistercoris]|uniref:GNAT family N-acetyltransferase n=1 Tax=Candidatus Scatomonas pullistercoris TaxID=2840920 RepID=A0A9D1P3W3_9FIRM|nr:GNAT family N-acetyltransferase [Candidatus Scatomonas pullistercoris]